MGSRQRHLSHLPSRLRRVWLVFVLGLAAVSVAALVPAPASAATRAPSYSAAFKKLDRAWRVFINEETVLLAETKVARKLCQFAEDVERDPRMRQYAPLMWSRLKEHVDTAGRPVLGDALEGKLAALKALKGLHSTFAKRWARQPARLRVLNRGTTAVLHADRFYSSGLDEIGFAFRQWRAGQCESAQNHVDAANKLMPLGDDARTDGMARLKSLR